MLSWGHKNKNSFHARIMPNYSEKLNEKYNSYWILWKKASEEPITLDFSDKENGRYMADYMYKELDNFRLHLKKNMLKPWSQVMFETVEKVQMIKRNKIITLSKKHESKVRIFRNYYLNNLPYNTDGLST